MIAYGLPVLVTLALWLGSTGVILHLDSQDRRTFVGSMLGAIALLAVSLWLVATTSAEMTRRLRLYRFCLRHRVVGGPTPGVLHRASSPARTRRRILRAPRGDRASVKPSTRVFIMNSRPPQARWSCSS